MTINKKKLLAFVLMLVVCFLLGFGIAKLFGAGKNAEPETATFEKSMKLLNKKDLLDEIPEEDLTEDAELTRSLMIGLIWRMEGCPEPTEENAFLDLRSSKWYSDGVLWAYKKIISGFDDGTFHPSEGVTAKTLAIVLQRYADWKDYELTETEVSDAIEWAVEAGLFSEAMDTASDTPISWGEAAPIFAAFYKAVS